MFIDESEGHLFYGVDDDNDVFIVNYLCSSCPGGDIFYCDGSCIPGYSAVLGVIKIKK